MNLTQITDDLAAYGYSLADTGAIIRPDGRPTGVRVQEAQYGRLNVRTSASNSLLWSGPRLPDFLESFWFAKKKI